VLLLSPFAVLTVLGFLHSHVAATTVPAVHGDFVTALLVAMWNFMGWDNAATVACEVEDPQRNYPRVMLLTLGAIVLSYMLPLAAVWHTRLPHDLWNNGSWASFASIIVGPWLGATLVGTAMLAEFGSFNSLVLSYSHLPVAMAEDGHLPLAFARKLKNGAPWVSVLVLGLAWGLSLGLNFDRLIMLDILLYGASLVLEFLALIVLRVCEPELPRPFRIFGGLAGAVLTGVAPTCLLVVALVKNRTERLDLGHLGSISSLAFGIAIMALGVVFYVVAGRPRRVLQVSSAD
jgi:amino acid transporter